MRVEYRRVPRVQAGVARGQSPSSSWWFQMEVQGFPLGRLYWADDLQCRHDRDTDELVITYRVPSVLPIKGSGNPLPYPHRWWPWGADPDTMAEELRA